MFPFKVLTLLVLFVQFQINTCENITFNNVRISLVSSSSNTRNTLNIESSSNLKDYIFGSDVDGIHITDQSIPTLHRNSIKDLTNIVSLDLSSNNIQTIQPFAFRNLGLLEILNLSSNTIEEITNDVFTTIDAKYLVLDNNRIYRIEVEAFNDLSHLNFIDLKYNRLRNWNGNWFKGTNLKGIDIAHNLLKEIPEDAFKFLDDLNTAYDQRKLHYLLFNYNEIASINRYSLPRLKELDLFDLSHNLLPTIEQGTFDSIEKLKKLDLSFNSIMYLDRNLFKRTKLHSLDLRNNFLRIVNLDMSPVINVEKNPLGTESRDEWEYWKKTKGHLLQC